MMPLGLMALAASGCIPLPPTADQVTAADLARGSPVFASAPHDTVVGYAPAPGVERWFSAGELGRIAGRLHLEGAPSQAICVAHRVAQLRPERVRAALEHALPGARIELHDWSRHPVPEGELDFPRSSLRASGLWTGAVRYGKNRRFAIWAQVSVRVSRTHVVAAQDLPPGRPILPGQVKLETSEGPPTADLAAQTLEQVIGRVPRRTMRAGKPVLRILLTQQPDVSRGDLVKVEVRHGSAKLELEARAEADGRHGETIAVLNPQSRRRFLARVESKGKVSVGTGGPE